MIMRFTKTKIKKAIALAWVVALSTTSLWLSWVYAASQIGTGSVTGTGGFDTPIMWDWTFTAGSASGAISGVKVKAKVLPTLTMEVSTWTIDLGTLVANTESTGSLFIEIGTNAKSWVSITARSGSGWLTNTSSWAIQINNLSTDGIAESYTFTSTPNSVNDSSSAAFSASGIGATQVNSNLVENTIYTTNKSESSSGVNDVEFVVWATINAETPAWDYEDNITFTVTGNF